MLEHLYVSFMRSSQLSLKGILFPVSDGRKRLSNVFYIGIKITFQSNYSSYRSEHKVLIKLF